MGLKDIFGGLLKQDTRKYLSWRVDPREGLDFILEADAQADPEVFAMESPLFGMQLAILKQLWEQGKASKNSSGYTVMSEDVVTLDDDFRDAFALPGIFPGRFRARFSDAGTSKSTFSVDLDVILPDGYETSAYSLQGPLLQLGETEQYLLSSAQWQAMSAVQRHARLDSAARTEFENNWLAFELQLAVKAGAEIDLGRFSNIEFVHPEAVGVAVEELSNGDLHLTPTFGSGVDVNTIRARLGQLTGGEEQTVFRAKNTFVLMDEPRLEAAKEILTTQRIPKEQVRTFLETPTAYLNSAIIDLDTGFSLRVHGAEKFEHKYFGDIEESGVDWFSAETSSIESPDSLKEVVRSPQQLEELEEKIRDAKEHKADIVDFEGHRFDISNEKAVEGVISELKQTTRNFDAAKEQTETEDDEQSRLESAVISVDSNDEQTDFAIELKTESFNPERQQFTPSNLKRQPFSYQEEGIKWLLAHYEAARESESGGGALLADDMGLGKTFMTLVSVEENMRRAKEAGAIAKPVLIVAPLSLLENWKDEVEKSFFKSPFSDIVILQGGADLAKFRVKGAGRETRQEFDAEGRIEEQDAIRYSLKIGKHFGIDRLDQPGRLVLANYATLREYQFSLARIDWSVVAFDEAQELKNPDTLASRASRALKSEFKLLMTGTPVENSLKDFWSLMDIAVPGLLGDWQQFRTQYIEPILSGEGEEVRARKIQVGRELRQHVGQYMLRRTKADSLDGLPEKRVFSGDELHQGAEFLDALAAPMKGEQLDCYDEIVKSVRLSSEEDKRKKVLPGLIKMKQASIHHDFANKLQPPAGAKELLKHAQRSSKLGAMLGIMEQIKKRDEKVIIFATSKSIQAYVAMLLAALYKLRVDIINGDTKAAPSKKDQATRKSIIDDFQNQPGFGAIIMSPIAAGVGLTVTGANNVIHLERHWNPAKEAQATDRVYRIGQERNVNVYLPMALHPKTRSFDLHLNSLLSNKIDLSDAVVSNPPVEQDDLMDCFT